jgi:hypothetical protein
MNYNNLKWYSKERQSHYELVNSSKEKQIGDTGEELAKEWFVNNGYKVRDSSAEGDSKNHADFYIMVDGVWKSIDVKYKKKFYIELINNWGNTGWIYTGADYIFQMFQKGSSWDTNTAYLYKREYMVRFMQDNMILFSDRFCTKYGKSKLWEVFPIRIKDMPFLKKVKI